MYENRILKFTKAIKKEEAGVKKEYLVQMG
jgi:hypothetical protein